MKIVYIHHSLSVVGGLERVWADKMNYLANQLGYKIYLITCDQNGDNFSYPLSNKIIHHDLDCIRYHSIYHVPYPQRLLAIRKQAKDYKSKLIAKIEQIMPDVIIGNTSFFPALIANLPYPCKKILEAHNAFSFVLKAGKEHRDMNIITYACKTIYDYYFLRQLKKYDVLVTLTQEDTIAWKKQKEAVFIPNPLTCYPESLKSDIKKKKTIVCAGRLCKQKGFDLLIQAWSQISTKYPDWNIAIYGDGNERMELERMIKNNNLESSFLLYPATNKIYDKLQESEFLVLSSRTEGFGLVLIEAMACGIPCVSFNCISGPSEIIKHGEDGILVENGSINELAKQIEWMITHEAERKEMGRKARIHAKRYEISNVMKKWELLFNELTQK
ncbi:MAG: glycosyltransferase family 4 protein [Phocaeicola sp.]